MQLEALDPHSVRIFMFAHRTLSPFATEGGDPFDEWPIIEAGRKSITLRPRQGWPATVAGPRLESR
jgi:hypothetical protein